jgi:hypothetical protein
LFILAKGNYFVLATRLIDPTKRFFLYEEGGLVIYKHMILKEINFRIFVFGIQFSLLIVMLLTFFSCQKEKDRSDPVIEIIRPEEGEIIRTNAFEVEFRVSDDIQLKYIRLSLANDQFEPVNMPVFFYPKGKDTTLNYMVSWDQGFGGNGEYKLQVLAEDGHNSKFKYRSFVADISVVGYTQLQYFSKRDQYWDLWGLDFNGFVSESLVTQSEEVIQLESGLLNGRLYTISAFPSKLQARDASDGRQLWHKEAAMPRVLYTHMFVNDNKLLLADASGTISMLNAITGSGLLTHHQQKDTMPQRVYFDEKYIYVANQLVSGGKYMLSLHYMATASPYKHFALPGKVHGIFQYLYHEVALLMENDARDLILQTFHKEDETFTTKGSFPGHVLRQVRATNQGELLLVSDKGLGIIDVATGTIQMVAESSEIQYALRHPKTNSLTYTDGSEIFRDSGSSQANGEVRFLTYTFIGD